LRVALSIKSKSTHFDDGLPVTPRPSQSFCCQKVTLSLTNADRLNKGSVDVGNITSGSWLSNKNTLPFSLFRIFFIGLKPAPVKDFLSFFSGTDEHYCSAVTNKSAEQLFCLKNNKRQSKYD